MKPIDLKPDATTVQVLRDDLEILVVPAPLHDTSGTVYGGILYTQNTLRSAARGHEISVQLIISDLVKHTAGNGTDGYWCGIGISDAVFTENAVVYTGFGDPREENLADPVSADRTFEQGGQTYHTFYWNAQAARDEHGNKGYVVIVDGDIHYHFDIDFSHITMKEAIDPPTPMLWDKMSVNGVVNHYLFGINLTDANGNPLPESLLAHYINAAVQYFENALDITISETPVPKEHHDYLRGDYQNWGYMKLFHCPVKKINSLRLMYGDRISVDIPQEWIQLDKLTGTVTLFPAGGNLSSLIIGNTGLMYGLGGMWAHAPQLWEVDYVAGMDENDPTLPLDLLEEGVSKRAAMGILNVWGDLIIGAGIASQSVSIDGISQSIGTTQSAMFGGASARVNEYSKDIEDRIMPILMQKFCGIKMIVV